MVRVHRIPIVGLVLSVACNDHPGGASEATTMSMTDSSSDTGDAVTTTDASHGATATGDLSTGDTTTSGLATDSTTGTGSETASGDETGTTGTTGMTGTTGTTGPSCSGAVGDATNLHPPVLECGGDPCAPGEVCVQRLACVFLPNLCEYYGSADDCYVEQEPTVCVAIPGECEEDPEGLEHCLEQGDDLCGFGRDCLCRYGGDYADGVLDCDYSPDQCSEGMLPQTHCDELTP